MFPIKQETTSATSRGQTLLSPPVPPQKHLQAPFRHFHRRLIRPKRLPDRVFPITTLKFCRWVLRGTDVLAILDGTHTTSLPGQQGTALGHQARRMCSRHLALLFPSCNVLRRGRPSGWMDAIERTAPLPRSLPSYDFWGEKTKAQQGNKKTAHIAACEEWIGISLNHKTASSVVLDIYLRLRARSLDRPAIETPPSFSTAKRTFMCRPHQDVPSSGSTLVPSHVATNYGTNLQDKRWGAQQ